MAFLFEANRGLTQINSQFPNVGPGSYNTVQQFQQNHGYAPFLTTGERIVSLVEKQKVKQPGPGAYEIGRPLGDSGVQAYMNKQTIIVKVQGNGTSSFISNQERFKQINNDILNVPGPGAYDQLNQNFIKNDDQQNKNNIMEDIRYLNNQRKIQSIPNSIPQQPGKQYQDIESFAKESQDQVLRSEINNRIGPGAYDITAGIGDNSTGGIQWKNQKADRFQIKQNTGSSVGPGKYNLNKRIIPAFKKNASPGFVSESVRSHFDQLIYNTNSDLKAELRRRTGYKESEIPGPGSYNIKVQSIKLGSKARQFQFFGSSLERFEKQNSFNLGPGHYQLNNSFDGLHKKKNYVNHTFMSTKNKDEIQKDLEENPGPGQYNLNYNTMKQQIIKKFTSGYKGSFGCTEKRFDGQLENQVDNGPGKYDIQPQQYQNRTFSSAFKSNTKRQIIQDYSTNAPSIGSYEINQYNISTKINKQANFLKNLKKIDVVKPGFDSGQARFRSSSLGKNDNSSQNNQSQFSNQLNEPSQIINKQNNGKLVKVPFISKTKRLDYQNNLNTPGVGQYQVEQNQWKKPSFNTHYNKIIDDD